MFYSSQAQVEEKWVKNSHGKLFQTDFRNENFEKFYAAQSVCSEEDFPRLLSACRRGLPSVFRIIKARPNSSLLRDKLRSGHLASLGAVPVQWYAGAGEGEVAGQEDLVWRLDNTRWELLEQEEHKELHRWLVEEDRMGNIYRQEQVSMVPVRCLDIQPHHLVLDMCASPGSKTGQVLEALHATPLLPTGAVIANEFEPRRSTNLYGNMREFNSPALLVTQHPGQAFPDLTWPDGRKVEFDHIVCDVPCSGDGTIRKNPNIWAKWHPARGNGRFSLQLNIARRGLELLKEGGTMAYSSCSINQIENEAVIAQLLREAGDSLELVDMTGKFPGLNWLPGLNTWRVFDNKMTEYSSMEGVPPTLTTQIRPEMFPPSEQEKQTFGLHKSMRFLPHLNDDGGFFVATLRKTGPIQPKPIHKTRAERREATKVNVKYFSPKIDNFIRPLEDFKFINEENIQLQEDVTKSKEFHGIDLPTENMYRFQDSTRNIRLLSDSLRDLLLQTGNQDLRIGGTPGTSIMTRSNMACRKEAPFFPKNSALQVMSRYFTKRHITASLADTRKLFESRDQNSLELSELSVELRDKLAQISPGWIIYSLGESEVSFKCVGYFSPKKMFLMLSQRELDHYMFLLNLHLD